MLYPLIVFNPLSNEKTKTKATTPFRAKCIDDSAPITGLVSPLPAEMKKHMCLSARAPLLGRGAVPASCEVDPALSLRAARPRAGCPAARTLELRLGDRIRDGREHLG